MTACKAVIFDLGKVVFDLSFDRVFESWAAAAGRPPGELKSRFAFDEVFDRFEKAEVTSPEFRALVSARLGLRLTDRAFDAGWCALYLEAYPGIGDLLAGLGQRYRLVALTNTNCLHSRVWPVKYAATLRHFERVFSSHELRARKPEARAYQLVLNYLQVEPAQAVFLDDSAANVAGAARLGLHTILVTSYAQMRAELQARELLP